MRQMFASAFLALLVAACAGGDGSAPVAARSTFTQIEEGILRPGCSTSGCHAIGQSGARQSGLVLHRDSAYAALVGVQSTLPGARAAGLIRVRPYFPDSSFLYHKLHAAGTHPHGSADLGSQMPIGGPLLSVGQLAFVRQWIAAGAPRDGIVADSALLRDRTAQTVQTFEPLPLPARGFQLTTGQFAVAPSFERELFVHRALGNAADVFINRIQTRMRTGSHHLLLYSWAPGVGDNLPPLDVVRDIRNPNGTLNFANMRPMGWHVYFAGSMTPESDYTLPPGVALRLPANMSLDLNSHYVNRGVASVAGEAFANLHTVPASEVQYEAQTLNLSNTSFILPPRQRTTVTKTFVFPGATRVFMLTSHMHERGERFVIRIAGGARDGEVVYENTDWEHPAVTNFATPIVLAAGQGLTSVITYNNTTDRTLSFGLTSLDEMGIIFGYFYY